MDNNKKYKLVGTVNPFEVYPCELIPVFEDEDGKYYRAFNTYKKDGKWNDCYYFTEFVEATPTRGFRLIQPEDTLEDIEDEYQVNSVLCMAFESYDHKFYIGRLDKYLEFIENYRNEIEENNNEDSWGCALDEEINQYYVDLYNEAVEDGQLSSSTKTC